MGIKLTLRMWISVAGWMTLIFRSGLSPLASHPKNHEYLQIAFSGSRQLRHACSLTMSVCSILRVVGIAERSSWAESPDKAVFSMRIIAGANSPVASSGRCPSSVSACVIGSVQA